MTAPVVDPSQPRFGCYIGNIDCSITLQMLREMFSACGTILDCSLNGNEEAPFRYGFIDFASEDDRSRALKYNGFTFAGRKLKVSVSRGNVGKPDGYGNAGAPREDRERRGGRYDGAGGGSRWHQHSGDHHNSSQAAAAQGSAQLLMQLIAQGAINVSNLTPEQQQQVVAAAMATTGAPPPQATTPPVQPTSAMSMPVLGQPQPSGVMGGPGMVPAPGMMGPVDGMMAAPAQGYMMAPPQGSYMGPNMWMPQGPGGYGNTNMMMPQGMGRVPHGQQQAYQPRPPANAMPSEDTLKLRELQRKQYFDVVRAQGEKYQEKYGGKASSKANKSDASSRSSSEEDEDEKH